MKIALGLAAAGLLAATALAQDASGVQILIDMQDPAAISKSFCVHDSKLFSQNAEICVSPQIRMVCSLVDANDPAKGVAWVAPEDPKSRCR